MFPVDGYAFPQRDPEKGIAIFKETDCLRHSCLYQQSVFHVFDVLRSGCAGVSQPGIHGLLTGDLRLSGNVHALQHLHSPGKMLRYDIIRTAVHHCPGTIDLRSTLNKKINNITNIKETDTRKN